MPDKKRRGRAKRWVLGGLGGLFAAALLLVALAAFILHRNAIPDELRKTPPELTAFARGPKPAATGTAPTTGTTVRWDRPHAPTDFEDYARFVHEHNPDDVAANLYLELVGRFTGREMIKGWTDASMNPDGKTWRTGDPLSQTHIDWLLANHAYIEQIRRMIAAGGVPQMRWEDLKGLSDDQLLSVPVPNFLFVQTMGKILCAEAQRLQQAGQTAEAAAIVADLTTYCNQFNGQGTTLIADLVAIAVRHMGTRTLDDWLASGAISPDEANRLQHTLDAGHLSAANQMSGLAMEWFSSRRTNLYLADAPLWDAMRFIGSAYGNAPHDLDDSLVNALMRHPSWVLGNAMSVIAFKAGAADKIAESDELWRETLAAVGTSYDALVQLDARLRPRIEARGFNPTLSAFPNFTEAATRAYTAAATRAYTAETGVNLDRAALRIVQDEQPPRAPDTTAPDWPASPWRDPFTEQPLRVVEESGDTLLYSLGPDLKDQAGAIAYDPTNGTRSAGDVIIRLPRQ